MRDKKQLVRLWKRPSKDGRSYIYYLRYSNLDGKRCSHDQRQLFLPSGDN